MRKRPLKSSGGEELTIPVFISPELLARRRHLLYYSLMRKTLEERFHGKYIPEPNSGCWLWTGSERSNGYGCICKNGKNYPAHRASYEIHKGPIPDGLVIDHLCRNRWCVNPDHLEAITQKENISRGAWHKADGSGFDHRHNAKKTHCPRGHPYSGENLQIRPCGRRQCRICHIEKRRRQRAAAGAMPRSSRKQYSPVVSSAAATQTERN